MLKQLKEMLKQAEEEAQKYGREVGNLKGKELKERIRLAHVNAGRIGTLREVIELLQGELLPIIIDWEV